jgi:CheY-like chemotaxis protein
MPAKVLIVEDNAQNRLLMVDILACHGFEVFEAGDGEEGIRMARELTPDLILLDMQMPVMDGIQAAKILKQDPATRGIKILAVTSFAMKGDRERILSAGADEYIAKPIDTRQLPVIVKKLLGMASG